VYRSESWMNIKALKKQGLSYREIGRRLGVDRRTVKKLAGTDEPPAPRARQRTSLLDPFAHVVEAWLEKAPKMQAKTIFEQLIPLGFEGGYTIVKEFVAKLKDEVKHKATVRFETLPGYQAQVDFGQLPIEYLSGEVVKETLFAFQMGFSRYRVLALAPNEKRSTLIDCLVSAFFEIGGVPAELLLDNLKPVVYRPRTATEDAVFQDAWILFCAHHGTLSRACWPYRGQTKGKVERLIGIAKSALLGRTFLNREHLKDELKRATVRYNNSIHSTTKMKPLERLKLEELYLLPLAENAYPPEIAERRKVSAEAWVAFEGNRYSVPAAFVKKEIVVKAVGLEVQFFDKLGAMVCTHRRRAPSAGEVVMVPEHYEGVAGAAEAFDHLNRLEEMGLSPFVVEKRPLSVYAEITE